MTPDTIAKTEEMLREDPYYCPAHGYVFVLTKYGDKTRIEKEKCPFCQAEKAEAERDAAKKRHIDYLYMMDPILGDIRELRHTGEPAQSDFYEVQKLRTRAEKAEAALENVRDFLDLEIDLSEGKIAIERLSGNIVKEEFWKGERSAYRQVEIAILAKKASDG
ncbi:MAG: hypothetical protein U9Q07_04015 [Planctomycetota bacterium]|nr:hypothetical protein [Planctomycetota bacterium]